ncbi:MAG: hypothetical protein JOZ77_01925 [Candidatus Eremiobacteraeota bacterium]|nr:hypothetical protein [Candidatus Eremiobacteraeota bacterium]
MKCRLVPTGLAVGLSAVLALTAGCGGSQTPQTFIPASNERSPVSSDAGAGDLLYVAYDNEVAVYSFPQGRFESAITGVRPNGLCSDSHGNVFIVAGNEIREYAHGGVRPVAIFRAQSGGFQFCAVDPTTGEVAVSGGNGRGIAIYRNARSAPRLLGLDDGNGGYWSSTFDSGGNLFAERAPRAKLRGVELLEFPKNGGRLEAIRWSGGSPTRLGRIQWDGQYLAVENGTNASSAMMLSRYHVGAGAATLVDTMEFAGAQDPMQFSIQKSEIVVSDLGSRTPASRAVRLYEYPARGSAATILQAEQKPVALTVSVAEHSKFAVTTYHYNNLRTGWNDSEFVLSPASLRSGSFGLLHMVALDDQVDAQPLVVPDERTTGGRSPGNHDVVYVATENDTIYAVDASSGAILFQRNLGRPVPYPMGCNNNGPNVGITATPVIDLAANVMYVIAYTMERHVPTYRIHQLSLSDLTDKIPSVVVAASHQLTNGKTYTFDATYQRQRPALLESNGNVYAGFGSFCDYATAFSRGWLLGWQAESLTPLAANRLTDSRAMSPDFFFLSAIWMSGYGPAADFSGNVFFVTGNSDPSGTTYNGVTNIQESVVKVNPDLTTMLSIFTPSDVGALDAGDIDFGAGGALLLPPFSNNAPPLAAAAGKKGIMFLLNQNDLGGYRRGGPNNDLDEKRIGACWCGLSYFDSSADSMPRIVASGGTKVTLWRVDTSPSIKLIRSGASADLPTGQDPGFFTTISSAGNDAGGIIWALTRPLFPPASIQLFALSAEPKGDALETLYHARAGTWRSMNANANLVPVVANGRAYVASYKQLAIFGMGGKGVPAATTMAAEPSPPQGSVSHQITGVLVRVSGSALTLRSRTGRIVRVDDSAAVKLERSSDLVLGEPFIISGSYDAAGVLRAVAIVRAKPSTDAWPPDR